MREPPSSLALNGVTGRTTGRCECGVRRRRPLFISVNAETPLRRHLDHNKPKKQRHNPNVSVKNVVWLHKKTSAQKRGLAPCKAPFFLGVGSVAPHKALTALQKRKTDD